jgi:hypothetical protein
MGHARPVLEQSPFEGAADALATLLPPALGDWHTRAHRWGVKLWFGPQGKPAREHYEAQIVNARFVEGASTFAIEVGFHAEHPKVGDNDAVLDALRASERTWRRAIGGPVEAGPFLGRPDPWRRISETWPDPDLGDPDLPLELAGRLVDYVEALEPLRRRSAMR